MLENYVVWKTAKYDQKSFLAHFQILMEIDTEICFHSFYITQSLKFTIVVFIFRICWSC